MATLQEALASLKTTLGALTWAGGDSCLLNVIVDTDDNPQIPTEVFPLARILVMGGSEHADDSDEIRFWRLAVDVRVESGGVHQADHGILGDAAGATTHTVGLARLEGRIVKNTALLRWGTPAQTYVRYTGTDQFGYDGQHATARINYEALLETE